MVIKLNNTTKLVAVTFLANLYFYNHVGTLYQQARGLSLFEVSSLSSIIIVTIFFSEVPTGVIADKIGRKWSVVTSMALAALGEWLYLFASSYLVFAFIAILAGLGFAFLSGANEALIYDTLPEEHREKKMKQAMGVVGGAYQLAFFIAPLVGGILVNNLVLPEFRRVILFTAVSVTGALLLSLSLRETQKQYRHPEEGPMFILKAGIKELKHSALLKRILLISTFTATFSGLLVSYYQPHFVTYHVPTFWIGAALALGGLFAAAAQTYAYKFEELVGKRVSLMLLSVLPGLFFILLALAKVPIALIPIFVITYALAEAKNPLLSSYKNKLIPSKIRATVLSLINMVISLYIAVMGLLIGLVVNHSVPLALAGIGILVIFASIALRVDKLPKQIKALNDRAHL